MGKKKVFILVSVLLCVIMMTVELSMFEMDTDKLRNIEQVKSEFQGDIRALRWGKYSNLTANDLVATLDEVEKIYNIQILKAGSGRYDTLLGSDSLMIGNTIYEKDYEDRDLGENFSIMNAVIDKFFGEEWDTSYLLVDFWVNDVHHEISYDKFVEYELEKTYEDGEYLWIFGNATASDGYMIQTQDSLLNTWFSKGGFGSIHPSAMDAKEVYSYLSGVRVGEDVLLHLKDGDIWLSEMEERVLQYLNSDAFPLPKTEEISYGIGEVRVIDTGDYEGVSFRVRRIFEGVPFEYGGFTSDPRNHDRGEIAYVESEAPDTLLSFGYVGGSVERVNEVKEILSLDGALKKLSEYLNASMRYEIQGIELVYRDVAISDEALEEVQQTLAPMWKFVVQTKGTKYRNYYYVDVVTGEVAYRDGNDR
ncbi:MAG: hypothetical protein IJ455_08525 [Agathobacter sp.]|nr:hypothetical protein [Agathobacter sp.]